MRNLILCVSLIAVLGLQAPARAETIYATTLNSNSIVKIDTSTNSVTTVASAGSPDSMLFLNSNTVLYTNYNGGILESLNLTTLVSTPLVSGLNHPADLVLEPGGNSLLLSEQGGNKIDRVNLSTNALTLLTNTGSAPGGLVYIGSKLYAITDRNGTIAQLNPTNGSVINSNTTLGLGLDGLTYDSFTGKLYATVENAGKVLTIDPTTLAASLLASGLTNPDGIASDGLGNLFIAELGTRLDQYSLITNTLTPGASVPGIDDPAPVSGAGAPPSPEPSSLALLALGACGLMGYARRRCHERRRKTALSVGGMNVG